tara:strand:+ start:9094 stop:9954 length:861 start_codon:yes stop_codon:yes gene_type:complete
MNINTYVRKNYPDFIDLYIRTSSHPHLFLDAWARHCEKTGIGCTEDQIEALIEKAEDEGEIEEGDIFVGEWYDIPKSRKNPRRQMKHNPKLPKKLTDRIDLANQYIAFAMKNNIYAEPAQHGDEYPVGMMFDKLITVSPQRQIATISYSESWGDRHSVDKFYLQNTDTDEYDGRYEFERFLTYIIRIIKYSAKQDGIKFERNNPRRQDDFIQTAFKEIDKDGTEGSFTRYVANNFYGKNTPQKRKAVAQKIKSDYEKWVKKGKKGKAPFALTTYRRAVFYLNIQKN